MPDVILLANVSHYYYLAYALHKSGYLSKFVTSIALKEGERVPSLLPPYWRRKLEGRRLRGLPGDRLIRLWLPELLQRSLPMLRLISADRGNWINNHLLDWMATRYIEECDIFHFLSSIGLYSARKAKAHGAKVVCDVRQEHPNFQRRILQEEQEKYGLNCMIPGVIYEEKVKQEFALSDYLIVPSSYAKKTFVAEGFDGKRIFVLPYGADLAFFYKVRRQDSVFRVLFVGKITLRKGVQYLLEAMRQLRLKHAELVLVGNVDPAMRPLLEKYRGLFRHIPSVPKVELFKYYSNASVMVLPSLADSFGLVILESMACGLPVIASEHTGAKEMFAEGVEGFVVPIRDIEALKEKILLFYENPEVRDDMGEAALRRAHQMTWYRYGQRAIEIYRSLEQADNHAYAPIKCAT